MYVPRDRYSLTMSFCVVPRSARRRRALLLGVGDVQRQQPRRRGVDRHRRVHLARRDAVEQRAHVAEVDDRHADLADLADGHRRVGVVAGLRRQVEGDRQPGLALRQVGAVQLVRRRGRRVPGVRPHQPRRVARNRLAHWCTTEGCDGSSTGWRHGAPVSERTVTMIRSLEDSLPHDGSVLATRSADPTRTAASSRLRYSRRGSSTAPSERRCGVIHCTSSSSAPVSRSQSTRRDERDLRGVGGRVEHRLAGEEPADAHAVEAADELAVGVALDRVGPAHVVEAEVGLDELRRDPAAGAAGIGAAHHDVGEARVPADLEARRAAAQRARRCAARRAAGRRAGRARTTPRCAGRAASGTARGGRRPGACPVRGRRRRRRCRRRRPALDQAAATSWAAARSAPSAHSPALDRSPSSRRRAAARRSIPAQYS